MNATIVISISACLTTACCATLYPCSWNYCRATSHSCYYTAGSQMAPHCHHLSPKDHKIKNPALSFLSVHSRPLPKRRVLSIFAPMWCPRQSVVSLIHS
ncbi:hypothetical protein B0J14DRAFT_578383 [Halenospora varia]|nr:hypothetical protein B0J14DRAFT_578383 [Halenospora varia]